MKDRPLAFIGDVHGHWQALLDQLERFNLRGWNLVQVGDLGIGFAQMDEIALGRALRELDIYLWAIRGNHDDPSRFTGGWTDTNDGIPGRVCLVDDHSVIWTPPVGHGLYVGGSVSLDRSQRRPYLSWWPGEEVQPISVDIVQRALPIDVMVTHGAPSELVSFVGDPRFSTSMARADKRLAEDMLVEQGRLDALRSLIEDPTRPQYWFFGHYHRSGSWRMERAGGQPTTFRCLDELEIYQFQFRPFEGAEP